MPTIIAGDGKFHFVQSHAMMNLVCCHLFTMQGGKSDGHDMVKSEANKKPRGSAA